MRRMVGSRPDSRSHEARGQTVRRIRTLYPIDCIFVNGGLIRLDHRRAAVGLESGDVGTRRHAIAGAVAVGVE